MTEFKSQICTTVEQSNRLLGLGLKPETADMCWIPLNDGRCVLGVSTEIRLDTIPAWSLHRLIEIMPRCIKCRNGFDYADLYVNYDLVQYRFYDTDYMHDVCYEHFNDGDVYSNVIDCIEWLIKEGKLNKELREAMED